MAVAREFRTEHLRNVVVLGHGGSGKTSLVDAACFVAGSSRRHGNVREGTALTMFTEEETSHGISMQTTPAFAVWDGVKVNLIDTPGYLDFASEVIASTRVADGAAVVVGAATGVEVGTERVWGYCQSRGIPGFFFVSMMDKEHADFDAACQQIRESLSEKAVPVMIPIGAGDDFRGVVDLFSGKAHIFKTDSVSGEYDEVDVPAELEDRFQELRLELFEAVATTDDELLEKYLEGESISAESALVAMKQGILQGEIAPIVCGAGEKAWGARQFLHYLKTLMPSPDEAPPEKASRPAIDQVIELQASDDGPLAALVFKTTTEPHVGELSFFRVFSGSLASGREVYNATRESSEKLTHLSVPQGRERLEVDKLHAGDIGVVAKLKNVQTNDTLCSADRPLLLEQIQFPEPDIAIAIRGLSRTDEDKISLGLQKLHVEDPVFEAEYDGELKQTIIRGLGELYLDVQLQRLKRKYGVEVATEEPRIRYRETIRKTAEGQARYKKQTGGRGQFGDCHVRLKPRARGEGYEFVDSITGGVIPGKYVPSVDKGIQEAARKGALAGYPVVDFEAECYDGSYHSVDSSDIAFQVAGSMAFRKVVAEADPVIIEPVLEVEVRTPEEYMGDVIGDLNQRRGRILGMDPDGRFTRIRALVPEAELYKYATALRSLTQGRAQHSRRFSSYEDVPPAAAQKIIETAKKEKEEEQG